MLRQISALSAAVILSTQSVVSAQTVYSSEPPKRSEASALMQVDRDAFNPKPNPAPVGTGGSGTR